MMHRTIHPLLKVPTERIKEFPRRKRLDIEMEIPVKIVSSAPKIPKPKVQEEFDDDYYYDDMNLDDPPAEEPPVEEQPV